MSDALKTLTSCMKKIFRESPEARKAMRECLDELERESRDSCISVLHAPLITVAPQPQHPEGNYYGNVRAHFDTDPNDHGWELAKIADSKHAIYRRDFKYGTVQLRYFFTTGTIQFLYPRSKHPDYASDEEERMEQERTNACSWGLDGDAIFIRQIMENFQAPTEEAFKMVLKTQTCRFSGLKIYPGKGMLFIRTDGQQFLFFKQKCKSLFNQRKRPAKIAWTVLYRKQHRKDLEQQVARKKRRNVTRAATRSVAGASLEVIAKKKAEKPEARKASREAALREIKDRAKKAKADKATERAAARAAGKGAASKNMPRGGASKGGAKSTGR